MLLASFATVVFVTWCRADEPGMETDPGPAPHAPLQASVLQLGTMEGGMQGGQEVQPGTQGMTAAEPAAVGRAPISCARVEDLGMRPHASS